ncbi:endoplasmic reticulum-Golgi intermediate compartment protein 2 isoform X2 [Harmonia axyridis]|nr:endoplasmic reticulum-Golgi intermediate compartment protein 2 isoform X2 [Harmonia axyridis]
MESQFIFRFSPDTDFDAKLKINIDITVAMPCSNVGADILDSTNQNVFRFGSLQEEDTWFELAPNQRIHFDNKKYMNSYLREEYHAVKDLLWKSSYYTLVNSLPPRSIVPDRPYDACRIYGNLEINKVSGNFHITAGKSLSLPRGHIHISAFMSDRDYNFSHRIDRFSFGDSSPGIIHPLEGDEMIANNAMTIYNYFIEVVPTHVKTFLTNVNTYQYSVKQLARPINHDKGSHGMPGLFFKYDVAALKVTISQERDHLGIFLMRLCSIIGGVYSCLGFIMAFIFFTRAFSAARDIREKREKENLKNVPIEVSQVVPVKLI